MEMYAGKMNASNKNHYNKRPNESMTTPSRPITKMGRPDIADSVRATMEIAEKTAITATSTDLNENPLAEALLQFVKSCQNLLEKLAAQPTEDPIASAQE